ncbi:MAG: Response regulator of zinc sigma-54-dependent two-component system, partial [uncultured Gemmatimonadetes bacterium]
GHCGSAGGTAGGGRGGACLDVGRHAGLRAQGGGERRAGAAAGRDGLGKVAPCGGDPPAQRPGARALPQRQLRRDPGYALRARDVRAHARRVHGRQGVARGGVRGRQRGHALFGRGGRAAAGGADQAPLGAGGAAGAQAGRHARHPGGRARGDRHQRRPGGDGGAQAVQGGPLPPHRRAALSRAAAARARARAAGAGAAPAGAPRHGRRAPGGDS